MYGTLIEADSYHTERSNSAWAGTDDVKTAALVRASDYIDARYRYKLTSGAWICAFRGTRTGGRSQVAEWPRTGAVDSEGSTIPDTEVPAEVIRATYELALRELVEPGSLSPDYVPSAQVTQETIGPITVKYSDGTKCADDVPPNMPVVPLVDGILSGLLRPRSTLLPAVMVA